MRENESNQKYEYRTRISSSISLSKFESRTNQMIECVENNIYELSCAKIRDISLFSSENLQNLKNRLRYMNKFHHI